MSRCRTAGIDSISLRHEIGVTLIGVTLIGVMLIGVTLIGVMLIGVMLIGVMFYRHNVTVSGREDFV